MEWPRKSVLFCYWITIHSVLFDNCVVPGQELNVVPNLLRPYFWAADQHEPINLMANISEKIFHFKKIGLSFGEIIFHSP